MGTLAPSQQLGPTLAASFILQTKSALLRPPQAVTQLILIDAQGFSDGVKPAPRFLSWIGVAVLRTIWLRRQATEVRELLC